MKPKITIPSLFRATPEQATDYAAPPADVLEAWERRERQEQALRDFLRASVKLTT